MFTKRRQEMATKIITTTTKMDILYIKQIASNRLKPNNFDNSVKCKSTKQALNLKGKYCPNELFFNFMSLIKDRV